MGKKGYSGGGGGKFGVPAKTPEERAKEVKKGMEGLKELIEICPVPTNHELKKLLGIQGALLNNAGLDLLQSVRSERMSGASLKKVERAFKMALKALNASREALKASAAIQVDSGDGENASESASGSEGTENGVGK